MPRSAVPTVAELEARIEEALVIARSSENGVREVGEMALDAARQARRAAEAAEASARAAVGAARVPHPEPAQAADQAAPVAAPIGRAAGARTPLSNPPRFEVRLQRFTERADRLSARLRALQGHSSHRQGPSAVAGRRRGDG